MELKTDFNRSCAGTARSVDPKLNGGLILARRPLLLILAFLIDVVSEVIRNNSIS